MKFLVNKANKGFSETNSLHGRKYFWESPCLPCFGGEFVRKSPFISPPLLLNSGIKK